MRGIQIVPLLQIQLRRQGVYGAPHRQNHLEVSEKSGKCQKLRDQISHADLQEDPEQTKDNPYEYCYHEQTNNRGHSPSRKVRVPGPEVLDLGAFQGKHLHLYS
jgi:hypothetical protein